MRQNFARSWGTCAPLWLALISAASLTGCASWLGEFKAAEAAKAELKTQIRSGVKLPDMPAELRTCLMKQACQDEAKKAKASRADPPQCQTADGILLAYVQSEREKRSCSQAMFKWYREQQKIQESASGMVKHPRSGTPRTPSWP